MSELLSSFDQDFSRRKYSGALLLAFLDLLSRLGLPDGTTLSWSDFAQLYPPKTLTASGATANTLIVDYDGGTISLRPFYNQVESAIRSGERRFGYPSCAPHATQSWTQYEAWFDYLLKLSVDDIESVRAHVLDAIRREFPIQDYTPTLQDLEPQWFLHLLEEFDFSARSGEPTGAAFQGAVFGFIRADNPHLQVEIQKVRTGSRRLGRVGDVDAKEGQRLAITAEVKHLVVSTTSVEDFRPFAGQALRQRAIGILVATDFAEGVREEIEALGLMPVNLQDLKRIVRLWDPAKHRVAFDNTLYYASSVEKNVSLVARLVDFRNTLRSRFHSDEFTFAS